MMQYIIKGCLKFERWHWLFSRKFEARLHYDYYDWRYLISAVIFIEKKPVSLSAQRSKALLREKARTKWIRLYGYAAWEDGNNATLQFPVTANHTQYFTLLAKAAASRQGAQPKRQIDDTRAPAAACLMTINYQVSHDTVPAPAARRIAIVRSER